MKNAYLIIIFLLLACTSKYENKISSDKGEYWVVYDQKNENTDPDFYYFNSNGIWISYHLGADGKLKKNNEIYHEKVLEKWYLKDKSRIKFGGVEYSYSFKNDSVVLLKNNNQRLEIRKLKNTRCFIKHYLHHKSELIDSIKRLHYNMVITEIVKSKSVLYLEGNQNSETVSCSLPIESLDSINIYRGDTIYKTDGMFVELKHGNKTDLYQYFLSYNRVMMLKITSELMKNKYKEMFAANHLP